MEICPLLNAAGRSGCFPDLMAVVKVHLDPEESIFNLLGRRGRWFCNSNGALNRYRPAENLVFDSRAYSIQESWQLQGKG